MKCLMALSQMPQEIVGEKAEVEQLYDAVNVLLYLQVHILFMLSFTFFIASNHTLEHSQCVERRHFIFNSTL